MTNNSEKNINRIIAFDYYNDRFFALCVDVDDEGKLICYQAKNREKPNSSNKVFVEDPVGNNMGFVIEHVCKFRIHPGCVRKRILVCKPELVTQINQMHDSLPPLTELVKAYKELKAQYYHTPAKESKDIRKKLGQLSQKINARQAFFLQKAKMKKKQSDKYRNYRMIPNSDGISHIYKGGSCSGK